MREETITIYDAHEMKPAQSHNQLLTYQRDSGWQVISYSRKHNAFNSYDSISTDEAYEHALDVDFWCELPDMENKEEK